MKVPLGFRVVNTMVDVIRRTQMCQYLFFKFFTSYKLYSSLVEREMKATRTIRAKQTAV